MFYGTSEDKRNYIIKRINTGRELSKYFPIVKKVIQQFDGKCYNCRLDKAIQEATSNNDGLNRTQLYCYIEHDRFITIQTCCDGTYYVFFRLDKDKLKDGKRIDASQWLDIVNYHYAAHLKRINDLENDLLIIDDTLDKLEVLKAQIKALLAPLSYTTKDTYNLTRITI